MEFGKTLREAREAKGYTVHQLSDMTHVLTQVIEGLEAEDFRKIAAPIYGRGFVKLCCQALDLDPKPMLDEFMAIYSGNRPSVRPLETAKRAKDGEAPLKPASAFKASTLKPEPVKPAPIKPAATFKSPFYKPGQAKPATPETKPIKPAATYKSPFFKPDLDKPIDKTPIKPASEFKASAFTMDPTKTETHKPVVAEPAPAKPVVNPEAVAEPAPVKPVEIKTEPPRPEPVRPEPKETESARPVYDFRSSFFDEKPSEPAVPVESPRDPENLPPRREPVGADEVPVQDPQQDLFEQPPSVITPPAAAKPESKPAPVLSRLASPAVRPAKVITDPSFSVPSSAKPVSRFAAPMPREAKEAGSSWSFKMPEIPWRLVALGAGALLILWILFIGCRSIYSALSTPSNEPTTAEKPVTQRTAPAARTPVPATSKATAPAKAAETAKPRTPKTIKPLYID